MATAQIVEALEEQLRACVCVCVCGVGDQLITKPSCSVNIIQINLSLTSSEIEMKQ